MSNVAPASAVDLILREAVLNGDITLIEFFPTAFGVALPASTAVIDSIVIDQDASFILYGWAGNISQPAGTNIPFPDVTLDVRNQGSGRYFSKNPMHWNTVMGNAQNVFFFRNPVVIPGASNLQITLTNLTAAGYARVDMTWIGDKARSLNNYDLSNLLAPADFAYTR